MFHFINLYKPRGISSREAVDVVQRLVGGAHKVGHAGTLDPMAEGVLVCCLGHATRLVEQVQCLPKQYRAVFLLGRESETEDATGTVVECENATVPTLAQLEEAMPRFVGNTWQRPPHYSAKRIDGKRAYRQARKGKEFSLELRPIVVHSLQLVRYEYPVMELLIECGSGVYIRSLGRDIAKAIGTVAVMTELVRTAIGPFLLNDSVRMDSMAQATLPNWLLPAQTALAHFPQQEILESEYPRVLNGVDIPLRQEWGAPDAKATTCFEGFKALTPRDGRMVVGLFRGEVLALLEYRAPGVLAPIRVFRQEAMAT